MIRTYVFLFLFALNLEARASIESGILFPTPDESILNLLVRKDLARADRTWFAVGIGASLFDARRVVFMPRWSPEVQVGHRFGRTGVFLRAALDQSLDFTQEVKQLDVYDLGIGVEKLFLYGRVRSSLSAGVALLGTQTEFDEKWTRGWYLDVRPVSVRVEVFGGQVIEIAPFTANLAIPVAKGIPLILFSYFTQISMEFGGS